MSEKRLARALLLLANFGKEGEPETITAKVSQETLAEMIGATRSRVSRFMNKFRQLGLIDYNGRCRDWKRLVNPSTSAEFGAAIKAALEADDFALQVLFLHHLHRQPLQTFRPEESFGSACHRGVSRAPLAHPFRGCAADLGLLACP